ncbi:hypothetical protein B0H17DRAFT_1136737 [Mycena rosella]|uniref:Uncharacterized protein n=1 Tax=Mycena rosella TaxID=1033263 RepID=A0AAD7D9W3_MYCRO|nr:hypothetical protein B0H17DRAFT_1136737 [Mycena rosella]
MEARKQIQPFRLRHWATSFERRRNIKGGTKAELVMHLWSRFDSNINHDSPGFRGCGLRLNAGMEEASGCEHRTGNYSGGTKKWCYYKVATLARPATGVSLLVLYLHGPSGILPQAPARPAGTPSLQDTSPKSLNQDDSTALIDELHAIFKSISMEDPMGAMPSTELTPASRGRAMVSSNTTADSRATAAAPVSRRPPRQVQARRGDCESVG